MNAPDFIAKHRAALECDYVSTHLHSWIELIFGHRQVSSWTPRVTPPRVTSPPATWPRVTRPCSSQRGPAAVSALNVFFYLTYEGNVDLASLADADLAARLKAQINNFGQMPPQLLHAAHPQRRPRPPAPVPCAPPGAHGVPCNKSHQLAAVALAMLPLDDSIIILDARRQLTAYKLGALLGGKGTSAPTPVGEAVRLPAFAPDITPSRAVVLAACSIATGRREAWLVSGGHWECSLCVSAVYGAGGTRQRLRAHSEPVACVALSGCGRWLMSGGRDATAMLWRLERGGIDNAFGTGACRPTHVLRGHAGPLLCVAISSLLGIGASGSADGTAALYTLCDGRRVRVLREPSGATVEQVTPSACTARASDLGRISANA